MRRRSVIVGHLLALPTATLLSLALVVMLPTTVSQEAIELALHDTYFVVAHFHASVLLASCVTTATLVAHLYGRLNWVLGVAWAVLILHLLATLVPWGPPIKAAMEPGTFTIMPPSHPGSAYLYMGSAVVSFFTTLAGLLVSLARALQSPEPQRA